MDKKKKSSAVDVVVVVDVQWRHNKFEESSQIHKDKAAIAKGGCGST